MPNKIERLSSVTSALTLTSSESTTPAIPYGAASAGLLFVESVAGASNITWHACHSPSATPAEANNGAPVVTAISAGEAHPIPDAVFAAPFLKAVTDSGTASVVISLKG